MTVVRNACRVGVTLLVGLVLGTGPLQGAEPTLDSGGLAHIAAALDHVNLTTNDIGFERDIAEPRLVLPLARRMLKHPLELPALGDRVLAVGAAESRDAFWDMAGDVLASEAPVGRTAMVAADGADALAAYCEAALEARRRLDAAFAALSPETRRWLACGLLADVFNAEDLAETRQALVAWGFLSNEVARVVAEGQVLDPAPGAMRSLDALAAIDMGELLAAGRCLDAATRTLVAALQGMTNWPAEPTPHVTSAGTIWIGTTNDDVYAEAALLILDPGGDDRYYGSAGAASGLKDVPLAVIVDLAGSDRYEGDEMLGPAAALFGVALIHDQSGDDEYRAAYAGLGAGLFGVAVLDDLGEGSDRYGAQALAQAAGYAGVGLLADGGGNDAYDLGFYGQGFGGPLGLGMLSDRAGDDRYHAGRRRHDFDRHDARYVSMAQGFAIGIRPFAGGGIGALVDHAGNDSYEVDVFGQGASYWYALGLLIDRAGDDVYTGYHYVQGTGIHVSCGLLTDGGGHDRYNGHALAQGSAHDYAVGVLVDVAGGDTYTAHEHSQGRGLFNGFALLLDGGGDDAYFARDPMQCQGLGHDGDRREGDGLGLLIDAAGHDRYSAEGAGDDVILPRPRVGVIYDVAPPASPAEGAP